MRATLFVSLTVNLLLVTSIVVARVDLSRRVSDSAGTIGPVPARSVRPSMPDGVPPVSTDLSAAADGGRWLDRYYRSLRSRGLSHEETVLPIAGSVLSTLFAESRRGTAYWLPPPQPDSGSDSSLAQLEDRMRSILFGLYGVEATDRPEFAMLYRPLGSAFGFLGSEQQIGILRWQRALLGQVDQPGQGAPAGGDQACEERGRRRVARSGGGEKLGLSPGVRTPPGLDPGQLFEYALRTSPLAARLRPMRLDEAAFRQAFRLLDSLTRAATLREHLDSRVALRRHLGPDRFADLWSDFDPSYQALANVLQQSGVAAHLVGSVYRIALDSEESLLSSFAHADALSPAKVAEIRDTEYERMASLVGSELASTIQALKAEPVGIDRGTGRAVCSTFRGA